MLCSGQMWSGSILSGRREAHSRLTRDGREAASLLSARGAGCAVVLVLMPTALPSGLGSNTGVTWPRGLMWWCVCVCVPQKSAQLLSGLLLSPFSGFAGLCPR